MGRRLNVETVRPSIIWRFRYADCPQAILPVNAHRRPPIAWNVGVEVIHLGVESIESDVLLVEDGLSERQLCAYVCNESLHGPRTKQG